MEVKVQLVVQVFKEVIQFLVQSHLQVVEVVEVLVVHLLYLVDLEDQVALEQEEIQMVPVHLLAEQEIHLLLVHLKEIMVLEVLVRVMVMPKTFGEAVAVVLL